MTGAFRTAQIFRNRSFQETAMILGIIGWVVVGLLIGFIASKVVNLRGDEPILGIGVGAAAALVVGILYSVISGSGVTAWNLRSILFAAIGALIGVVIWHFVRSRYASREIYTSRRSY
jgi:uncharacterized membrane protein YeaQ/YmgE (transglycosylase-associated protein family)